MASRRAKSTATTLTAAEQAQRVWLAGLGVLAVSYRRGSAWLVRMVEEGRTLQAQGTTFAREAAVDLQAQAVGVLAPLQVRAEAQGAAIAQRFDDGMAQLLHRLGIPARRDIDALNLQLAALTRKLRARKAR